MFLSIEVFLIFSWQDNPVSVRCQGYRCPSGRYRVRMSTSSGHPLRRLLLLVLAIGVVVVVRNATADRGGSYDPSTDA